MIIQRLDKVLDPQKQDELWQFYHNLFEPLNEQTPLAQSLDRPRFISWMKSSRAAKIIATNGTGEVTGLAIISSDLRHDPLISIPYFKKHFAGKQVFHIPVIAVPRELSGLKICELLMQNIMAHFPIDAVAIFFHSQGANPLMQRLVERCCAPKVKGSNLDSMGCVLLHMVV
jgi:hypothetical protein